MKTTQRNPKYNTRITNVATNAVIVHRSDWKRVKKDAVHLTPEQQKELREREARTKREQMLTITKKRESLMDSQVKPETLTRTHQMLETFEEKPYALQLAESKADEDLDEIKKINSEMVAARARTERDQQLIIHQQQREEEKQREKSMAEMLETNRKQALDLYEQREASLKSQRRAGRRIIDLQIEEHKINAILEAERRDREAKALAIQNEKVRQEDERIRQEALARKKAFLHDCIEAEEALKKRRADERALEKEEAQMQIDFAAEKALREERIEKEKRDQKALKEREIQEIRAKQQRAIDTKAIRDELMAQRVQEEKNRLEDEREERDMMKKIAAVRQLKKDRDEMVTTKRLDVLEQQKRDRQEWEAILAAQEKKKQAAIAAWKAKQAEDVAYREELRQQVEEVEESRRIDPAKIHAEEEKIRAENDAYMARVERIKQRKLQQLEREGVPAKYRYDIERTTFQLR